LSERAHSSTAKAMQICQVLIWDLPTFKANLDRFPQLFRNAMSIGVRQMNELSRRICEISTGTALPRLAHSLIRLSGQIGHRVNSHFELHLTQEVLAQMTAMNIYTLNRQLSQLQEQGLVACHRGTVVVRDLPGLEQLCSNSEKLPR
jgi:CRP-like cAMP-binding protein